MKSFWDHKENLDKFHKESFVHIYNIFLYHFSLPLCTKEWMWDFGSCTSFVCNWEYEYTLESEWMKKMNIKYIFWIFHNLYV